MQLIISLILVLFITNCDGNHSEPVKDNMTDSNATSINSSVPDTFQTGKVISPVFCKSDAAESYALYIPALKRNETLPVIYFFDPHGAGELPLNKYKKLADKYGFILIGSNNSKNGNDWPAEEKTWNNIFYDTQGRLKINADRIYICGFSGGAKVAIYTGMNHSLIKGVIANGAGLPGIANGSAFKFSFTAITGYGDMNMTDLVAINAGLDKTNNRHRIIFFNGKHEWAPENTMSIAFAGLQFDAMRERLMQVNDTLVNEYDSDSKKRISDHLRTNDLIKAEAECLLSINLLGGLSEKTNWFKEKALAIGKNPAYQQQKQAEESLLATEQNLKMGYEQQFQQGDMNYWKRTITDIQTNAKAKTATGAMYQRLQAYLSLAFYSISNQLINANRNSDAAHFVELYKMDDAANSEAWYFSAILNARNNDAAATERDLLKAVGTGFTDVKRILQQPEFKKLSIDISAITKKIKNEKHLY